MVRPDMEPRGQTLAELRVLSVEAKDARSRERFLALYMIADKQTLPVLGRSQPDHQGDSLELATSLQSVWAQGRVLSSYGWTSPFFSPQQVKQPVNVICSTEPVEHGLPGHGWTLKKLRRWHQAGHGLRSRPPRCTGFCKQRGCAGKSARRCSRKPTHRNVPPLWNASKNCMHNNLSPGDVWSILMKPTSTAIWRLGHTWAEKNKIAWRMSAGSALRSH